MAWGEAFGLDDLHEDDRRWAPYMENVVGGTRYRVLSAKSYVTVSDRLHVH